MIFSLSKSKYHLSSSKFTKAKVPMHSFFGNKQIHVIWASHFIQLQDYIFMPC
jgi:hypothetical protein